MNYTQTVKFLSSWSKLGRKEYLKDPQKCGAYLERLQFFLDLIGNPEKIIPHYIHVTGTSGKGSVCLMLDSILGADKRRVGIMTSPEIGPIQTRWQINGKTMTQAELTKIMTELKPKLAEYLKTSPYDPISHFELMTAIGLYWFAKKKVSWCILEVGMGGRYDSTNVIPHKDIAVITNIGLDHTDILGKTKAKIAYEKAGIIKCGNPVFTAERDKKILKVIQRECKKQKASLKIADFRFQILEYTKSPILQSKICNLQLFKYQNHTYNLNTLGEHQIVNATLAIEIAKSLKISYSTTKHGLATVKLPLRMEIISQKPLIILDGAHNPDKMKTTVDALNHPITKSQHHNNNSIAQWHNVHLLIAFSADKDITTMCRQLSILKPKSITITKFTSSFKKCAEPKDVEQILKKYLPKLVLSDSRREIKTFNNSLTAFNWSKKHLKKNDLLLVTGSLYLSGEIRIKLTKVKK